MWADISTIIREVAVAQAFMGWVSDGENGVLFMMTLVWFRSATMDQASEVFGMLWIPGYIGCRLDGLEGIAAPTLAHGLQIPLFCVYSCCWICG